MREIDAVGDHRHAFEDDRYALLRGSRPDKVYTSLFYHCHLIIEGTFTATTRLHAILTQAVGRPKTVQELIVQRSKVCEVHFAGKYIRLMSDSRNSSAISTPT